MNRLSKFLVLLAATALVTAAADATYAGPPKHGSKSSSSKPKSSSEIKSSGSASKPKTTSSSSSVSDDANDENNTSQTESQASEPPPKKRRKSSPGSLPTQAKSNPVPVNQAHVFDGEVNKRGQAVGFHHRSGGKDPSTATMTKATSDPDHQGIYTGKVAVNDPKTGTQVPKRAESTFYPDDKTPKEINNAIQGAYVNRKPVPGKPANYFQGTAPHSKLAIGGYTDPKTGNINTAYPIQTPPAAPQSTKAVPSSPPRRQSY